MDGSEDVPGDEGCSTGEGVASSSSGETHESRRLISQATMMKGVGDIFDGNSVSLRDQRLNLDGGGVVSFDDPGRDLKGDPPLDCSDRLRLWSHARCVAALDRGSASAKGGGIAS